MIKHIIFDFGGVMHQYNFGLLMKELSGVLGVKSSWLRKRWLLSITDFELGKCTNESFWRKVLGEQYRRGVSKKLVRLIVRHLCPLKGTYDIMHQLRKRYAVGMITNNVSWITDFERAYHFRKWFHPLIASHKVGLRKPNKKFFRLYLKKSGCKPEEAVFIDDTASYRESVESLGIHFIHFKNPKQLKKKLEKLGVEFLP